MFDLSSVYERCSKTIDNTSTDFGLGEVQKYHIKQDHCGSFQ